MIKLNKQPEPEVLVREKAKWTLELMSLISAGANVPEKIKNRYNQPEIKSALRAETNGGKCMYCESPIAAVASEHIEHYKPKSIYPELTFEWTNLGLSCPKCNINKGNVFDEKCMFINPYIDYPENHFISLGTIICHIPNDKRAKLTELHLQLNRPKLMEARKERIDAIRPLIEQYVSENNPTMKDIIKKNIEKEIAEDKPYSMCTKTVYEILINTKS